MSHTLIAYTDGSALGNPGKGGWGYMVWNKKEGTVTEGGGHSEHATNNQMELKALLGALEYIQTLTITHDVVIHLDSEYVRKGIMSWIHGWKKNNWRTAAKKPVLNKELWVSIDEALEKAKQKHEITLTHVDGHTGVAGNETVDAIARTLAESQTWDYFSGPKESFETLRGFTL